ncbi:MAG: hypothetical protein FWD71_20455 [Oscillospiraceae bacterium]|nr:hypothetical protein [Oscillospiraceae bacterium]
MLDSVQEIKRRKQKWIDFYDGRINSVVLINQNCGERPLPYPENKTERIEYALKLYRIYLDSMQYVDDDRIPYIYPYTGTEIFAHAFGCGVHYPVNDMPFALPFIHSSKELAKVKYPDLKNSYVSELFELADKLRSEEPDALLALPDIQSPLDIAALIWNKEDFFTAMYDDPQAVNELIAMTEKFLIEFLDLWFDKYGKDFIAHYPDYYMPYGITLSEDEVGAISPAMFKEFSLDSLNRLSDRYGIIGMHCCANSVHQWANFKLIRNLKLLNIVQPYAICQKAYVYFKDVCAQMHGSGNVEESVIGKKENKNIRAVIQDYAENRDIASEKGKSWRIWEEKFTKN